MTKPKSRLYRIEIAPNDAPIVPVLAEALGTTQSALLGRLVNRALASKEIREELGAEIQRRLQQSTEVLEELKNRERRLKRQRGRRFEQDAFDKLAIARQELENGGIGAKHKKT